MTRCVSSSRGLNENAKVSTFILLIQLRQVKALEELKTNRNVGSYLVVDAVHVFVELRTMPVSVPVIVGYEQERVYHLVLKR